MWRAVVEGGLAVVVGTAVCGTKPADKERLATKRKIDFIVIIIMAKISCLVDQDRMQSLSLLFAFLEQEKKELPTTLSFHLETGKDFQVIFYCTQLTYSRAYGQTLESSFFGPHHQSSSALDDGKKWQGNANNNQHQEKSS
jgi:hypothetical protein